MPEIFLLIALFAMQTLYFKIASRFNIVDRPNARSSHANVTLRGGGVIFFLSAAMFFVTSGFQYPLFFVGLTILTAVSFIDDIFELSNRIRLLAHFSAVLLFAYELEILTMHWFYLLITFVTVVGLLNAYSFIDVITWITA